MEEIGKDGTFERKIKTLESYFEKTNTSNFIKRTKRKKPEIVEQISDDESERSSRADNTLNILRQQQIAK